MQRLIFRPSFFYRYQPSRSFLHSGGQHPLIKYKDPTRDPIPQPIPTHKPKIIRKVEELSTPPLDIDLKSEAVKLQKEAFTIIDNFNHIKNPLEFNDQLTKAKKLLEEALSKNPHKDQISHLYYGLGLCYMRQGDWLACEASYKKAVDNDVNFVPAYEGMAESLMMQGEYELALAWFTKFFDTFPEYYNAFGDYSMTLNSEDILAQLLFKRGVCYFKIQDYTCAAGDFNHCIGLDRNYVASCFHWLGKIACVKGKLWDAVALFSKAIERDPKLMGAYLDRGDAYAILNQDELAESDRKKYQILKREAVWKKLSTKNQ